MEIEFDRRHAAREDDFVVFLVGMRINRFRAVHRWLPVFLSAPRMVREQKREREGLLGSRFLIGGPREFTVVQYWESFEALRAYAREGGEHRSMWSRFNAEFDDGSVGIWHETYLVRDGEYETVYRNMPESGLGAADGSELVTATGQHETAGGRLGRTDGDDAPVTPDGTDDAVAADGGARR
jgi:hypothetical protein